MLNAGLATGTADLIAQYREDQLRETYRKAAVGEALLHGRETNRRLRAEEAAEVLAQRAAIAEETALRALAAVEELEADKADLQDEIADVQEQLRSATITLSSAHTETAAVSAKLVRQLQELEAETAYASISLTASTKRETRARRNALESWRVFKFRAVARRLYRRRVIGNGITRLARPNNDRLLRELATKAHVGFRSAWRLRGYGVWRKRFEAHRKLLADHKRSTATFRHVAFTKALRSWTAIARSVAVAKGESKAAKVRFRKDGLQQAIATMANIAQHRRHVRMSKGQLISQRNAAMITSAVATWSRLATASLRTRRALAFALQTMPPRVRVRELREVLSSFIEAYKKGLRLRRASSAVQARDKLFAFSSLQVAYLQLVRQRATLRQGRAAIRRRAFHIWSAHLRVIQRDAQLTAQLTAHALRVQRDARLRRAWAELVELNAFGNKARGTISRWSRTITRMEEVKIHIAFREWHESAVAMADWSRRMRSTVDLQGTPREHMLRAALGSFAQMCRDLSRVHKTGKAVAESSRARTLVGAFTSVLANSRELMLQAALLRRGIAALRGRFLFFWRANLEDLREEGQRMARSLRRQFIIRLRRGWTTLLKLHLFNKLTRSSSRCVDSLAISKAISEWHAHTADIIGWRRFKRDVLAAWNVRDRMIRAAWSLLAQAYEGWVELRDVSKAVLDGCARRALKLGLGSWLSVHASARGQLSLLRRGRDAFARRGFVACETHAREARARKQVQKLRMATALQSFRDNWLRKAWQTLLDRCAVEQLLKVARERARSKRLRYGIVIWYMLAFGRARWARKRRSALRQMDPRERAMRRAMHLLCLSARYESKLKYVASYTLLTPIRFLFGNWAEIALEQAALARQRSQTLEGKALLRLRNHEVHKGFLAWYEKWEALTNAKRAAGGAIRALQNNGLRKGWFTWRSTYEELLEMKGRLAAFSNPGLKSALNSWLEFVEIRLEARRKLKEVANEFSVGGGMRAAFEAIYEAALQIQVLLGAVASMQQSQIRAAINSWRENTDSKRNRSMKFLLAAREGSDTRLRAGWLHWRSMIIRDRVEELVTVRNMLWVQPAFDVWVELVATASALQSMGLGASPPGYKKAFRRWASRLSGEVDERRIDVFVRRLYRRTEMRVCDRGESLLRQLRHTGLRGVTCLWRRYAATEAPQPSTAWARWKARATRLAVAQRFAAACNAQRVAEGLYAIREAAFAHRLQKHTSERTNKRRVAEQKLRKQLTNAEHTARMCRQALEEAEEERDRALEALEKQRLAAIDTLEAERAAAMSVLTPRRRPESALPTPSPRPHRWSTAAARGHSKLAPEKLDQVIQKQFQAATRVRPLERFAENQEKTNAAVQASMLNRTVVVDGSLSSPAMQPSLASSRHPTPIQILSSPLVTSAAVPAPTSAMTPQEVFAPYRWTRPTVGRTPSMDAKLD